MQEWLLDVNVADGVGNEEIIELVVNREIVMERCLINGSPLLS